MTKATLGPDTVDKIYTAWRISVYQRMGAEVPRYLYIMEKRYLRDFGDWLWSHGGNLRRDNKKYYIDFREPDRASFFMLKYL